MLIPKYTITNEILTNIGIIEACREAIENAPMIPSYEKSFQDEALLRTVHYGTHIEGNELSLAEARKIIETRNTRHETREKDENWGEGRDVQEIINYRRVMKHVDSLASNGSWVVGSGSGSEGESGDGKSPFLYTKDQLLKMHALTVERILPDNQCGKLRNIQVVAKDSQTGKIILRYPPSVEVPFQIDGFLSWLNGEQSRTIHPVLRAGITHYLLAAIHPFVEGNGRVSRAFATLVLFTENYNIKKLFSLEEYFDKNAQRYFTALKEVSDQSQDLAKRDLTLWLEFFSGALAAELSKTKDKVKLLSFDGRFRKKQGGKQIVLSPRQLKLIEHLEVYEEMSMQTAKEILPMVSEDTILRDLKDLIKKKIIKKKGKTKGAKYYVA